MPRSLGIAAPSYIFYPAQLQSLVSQARSTLQETAIEYSNGNPKLAKGIQAQLEIALKLYEEDKELPLVLNLGMRTFYTVTCYRFLIVSHDTCRAWLFRYGSALLLNKSTVPITEFSPGPTPFATRPKRTFTSINSILFSPLSRGRSHIASSDPSAPPHVDPNYLAHPLDIAAQIEGTKLARRTLREPPLNGIFNGGFEPGAQVRSDEEIEEWLRGVAAADGRETGTASMMPEDMGGVVDTSLKVYGTSNVRVAGEFIWSESEGGLYHIISTC